MVSLLGDRQSVKIKFDGIIDSNNLKGHFSLVTGQLLIKYYLQIPWYVATAKKITRCFRMKYLRVHACKIDVLDPALSPCIMCVQYRGGCSAPWGHIISTVGDILSTVGVFSTMGDIMINVGDILSTMGVFSTVGDIMSTVGRYHEYRGVILSTMGVFSTVGDIMTHVGVFSTVGYPNNKRFSPHGTEHPPWYS